MDYCIQDEGDLPYEEEILRNPYQIKPWMRYIQHKKDAPASRINLIYERALKELPGWYVFNSYFHSHLRLSSY